MAKRKREDAGDEEAMAGKPCGIKQQRVEYKLEHGVKRVAHAFKLAKGFERQKLSRRRKTATAQEKAQDVKRIDAEIVALKALDHAAAAQQHVHKSLLKIKAVAGHEDLPAQVSKPAKKVTDAPTLNVIARLCKSNQAKEALEPVISDVQNALGLEGGTATKKKRKRAKDYEDEADGKSQKPSDKSGTTSKEVTVPSLPRGDVQESEEDDFADYEDRLASSDDEDGEVRLRDFDSDDDLDSDQSIGALERQLESEGIQQKGRKPSANGYNHEADISLSEAESDIPSASPEPQKVPAVKKSAFLPTLTMGGYISGSGSDIEDEIDSAPKKNRRGQRARQQLWEKKYGTKAKHLQKDTRKAGWDAKHGATDGTERHGKGRGQGGPKGKPGGSRPGQGMANLARNNTGELKKKHRDDGGAIHPSWEAAKKAKERKEAPAAFQGKKITFD